MNIPGKLLLIFFCCAATTSHLTAQKQYTYEDVDSIKACFRKFCDTDTIPVASLKKLKSLKVVTNTEGISIVEFTLLLTAAGDVAFMQKIKADGLDQNYVKLLTLNYLTVELVEIIARDKDDHVLRLKPRKYQLTL